MHEHRPPHQNNLAARIVLVLFFLAGACFVTAALVPAYPVIWQTVGVCFFVPILQLSVRYIFTKHLYRVRDNEDGALVLEIFIYRGGSKMQLVCRVELSAITALAPYDKDKEKPVGVHRQSFCPDLSPKFATVLAFQGEDGAGEILFCPDIEMVRFIENHRGTTTPNTAEMPAE